MFDTKLTDDSCFCSLFILHAWNKTDKNIDAANCARGESKVFWVFFFNAWRDERKIRRSVSDFRTALLWSRSKKKKRVTALNNIISLIMCISQNAGDINSNTLVSRDYYTTAAFKCHDFHLPVRWRRRCSQRHIENQSRITYGFWKINTYLKSVNVM